MNIRSLFVAVTLGSIAAVSHAVPLEVSFVPHDGESDVRGPKDALGHYEFAFVDADKKAPPAQAFGQGLANFPSQAGGHQPELPMMPALPELPPVSQAPGQGMDQGQAFNPPGLSLDNPGQGNGSTFGPSAQVSEPGSLALLTLSLTGLLALRLGRRARSSR